MPAEAVEVEDRVRRSRFITRLGRAASRKEAGEFVEAARTAFPDATHHCWAFNAGPPGSTAQIGMSDDGEPHGTAGRPMLTALLHAPLGEVVAVCIRYYGGVKLGTGGLARAYGAGVKHALEECRSVEKVDRRPVTILVSYEMVERVDRLLEQVDAVVEDRTFGEAVEYRAQVPVSVRGELEASIAEVTAGRGVISYDPSEGDSPESTGSSR